MSDTAPNTTEDLVDAYNKAVSSGFAAADAGFAQATAAAKVLADSTQSERDEFGKVIEQTASHARARGENIASTMQGLAAVPVSGPPSFTPEAKEALNKLVEGEMAFYQAWTKSWMDYLAGAETRRNAAAKALLESNTKAFESGQEAVKSAVKCSEAFFDWSMEAFKAPKS